MALLRKALSKSFSMKYLGSAKQILGMKISRDRSKKLLWLSQERYIEKVFGSFSMKDAKYVTSLLVDHHKLNSEQCLTSKKK